MNAGVEIEKLLAVPLEDRKLNSFGKMSIAYYLKEKYNLSLDIKKIENKVAMAYMTNGNYNQKLQKLLECPEIEIPEFFNKLVYHSPKSEVIVKKCEELVKFIATLNMPQIQPHGGASVFGGLFSMYNKMVDLDLDQPNYEIFYARTVTMFKGHHYLEKLSPRPIVIEERYVSPEKTDMILDFIFSSESFRDFLKSEGLLKK